MSEPDDREHAPAAWDDAETTTLIEAFSPGSFFADRFRIGCALGAGAMGRVLEAVDLTSGQDVALKVLRRDRAGDAEALSRFEREAAILRELGHPGIVRIVAVGRAPDGTPWLAMELLRGVTLERRLAAGPMQPLEIVPVLNALCDALAAAHHAGVVHRDLKPQNVILLAEGSPPCKILDFGLSRFAASKTLTRTGTVLGTPRYMAPELIRSASTASHLVDVYAIGVLLFEMLTARSPYPAEDVGQLLGCVLEGRTVPLAELRPDLPAAVGAVLARAMARTPEERFQTAGAVAEAYANALGVPSGRSRLSAASASGPQASVEGAEPLVDPFAPSMAEARTDPEPPVAELARHPLLDTLAPGRLVGLSAAGATAAQPAPGPESTRSRPSTPTPDVSGGARAPRAPPRWTIVVAAVIALVIAVLAAIGARAALSGTLRLPWGGASP